MCVLMCNFVSYFVCVILCIFVFLCDILLLSGVINDEYYRLECVRRMVLYAAHGVHLHIAPSSAKRRR